MMDEMRKNNLPQCRFCVVSVYAKNSQTDRFASKPLVHHCYYENYGNLCTEVGRNFSFFKFDGQKHVELYQGD